MSNRKRVPSFPYNTSQGYRLLSIDGTILEISNTENLRNEFGYIENQSMKVARARAAGLYDVENDMIITAVLRIAITIECNLTLLPQ
ncbi:hypothetical protein G9F72_005115 [Clostridium estertheticum]|uniref:hypothetical protein n=1 Tax=Clostridium estertheticum TaxID=238834 RepID=UPI001CD08E9F|nr:hypothetical protein [Clostridium estertheticum]MBZ9685729.1 hypothetical protein [Clostridium estertheticum]